MEFAFGNNCQSLTLEFAKEQPKHSPVISPARRDLENRAGVIDREHGLPTVNPLSWARFSTWEVS